MKKEVEVLTAMGYILPINNYTYEQYATRTDTSQYDFAHINGVERISKNDRQQNDNQEQDGNGQSQNSRQQEKEQPPTSELKVFMGYVPPNPAKLPEAVRQAAEQPRMTENPYN